MKRLIILAVVLALAPAGFGDITVGNASFDEGLSDAAGFGNLYSYDFAPWTTGNGSGWIGNGYYAGAPAGDGWYFVLQGGTVVSQTLDATFSEGVTYYFNLDVGTYVDEEYDWEMFMFDATGGDPATPLASISGRVMGGMDGNPSIWYNQTVSYTATAAEAGNNIGIGFTGEYYALFDHASVYAKSVAWGPDPEDKEPNVDLSKVLSWNTAVDPNTGEADPAITAHELYMSNGADSDPNLYYVDTFPATGDRAQYTPGGEWLSRDATYYWRVDEVTDTNTIAGNVWTFDALLSIPAIDPATPADALVDENEGVVFTVSAVNPFTGDDTGLRYQWYEVGVGPTGTDSPILTINAQPGNIGEYYCTVTIVSNSETADSRSAILDIKELLGHWKLDETSGTTAADSSDSSNTGTVSGAGASPGWTTGADGGALSFDGTDYGVVGSLLTDYVDCGSDISLQPTMQVTVSGWYNTDTYSYYGQIAGFAYDSGADESGYAIFTEEPEDGEEGGYIGFWLAAGNGVGTYLWTSEVPATPTGWTHVAGTYDGTTMRLYINGVEKATSTEQNGYIDYDHVNSFRIGVNESAAWWLPYKGDIDDVRVYSYVLDPYEIALLFVDVMSDETVCVERPMYDFNEDCIVNLADFAEFLVHWMECNSVPDCRP